MSFTDVSRVLAQRVRYRVLTCFLARLGVVVVKLRCVPIMVSWWNGETTFLFEQLLSMGVISTICLPLARIKVQEDIMTNDVLVITALSFFLTAVSGALPFTAVALLLLAGAEPFSAFTHALSGVSTGGFSIYDRSIGSIQKWHVQLLIVLFSLAGAISLPFYYRLVQQGFKEFFGNQEVWGLLSLSAVIVVILMLFSYLEGNVDWLSNIKQALVLGLSAQTTTGFSNVDVAALDSASKLTLIVAMLVGGSTGSTAGGIKILRFLIVLRMLQLLVARTALPAHAILEPRLGDDYLESGEIEKAVLLFLIFIGTVGLSWLPFLVAGYAPLDALLEVVSACSTTGLSSGITTMSLETGLKIVLIIDMLLGRVEFLAFIMFLYPRTWISLRS